MISYKKKKFIFSIILLKKANKNSSILQRNFQTEILILFNAIIIDTLDNIFFFKLQNYFINYFKSNYYFEL